MRWFRRRHRHEPVREHTTNLGYFKETCSCGAYRCRAVLGELWVEPTLTPKN
jgi:hypothetical protein